MVPIKHFRTGNHSLPHPWQFATMDGMTDEAPSPAVSKDRPPWLKRRWVRVTCALTLLLIFVGLAAPYFLNADRLRVALANLIASQTGRDIALGQMRVRLLPRVGFEVESFHMGNPSGFAKGEFLGASEIRGTLAFWPLVLHHEYRITSLELVKPKLALLEDNGGRDNYTFAPAQTASVRPRVALAALDGSSAAEVAVLQVDELTLRDAEVIYGTVDPHGQTVPLVDASGFSAVLLHLELQPLHISAWQAAARLGGAQLTLAGWKGPIRFRNGDISLRSGALESSFTVDLGSSAAIDGKLTVANVEQAEVKFDLSTADLDLASLISSVQTTRNRGESDVRQNPAFLLARDIVSGGTSSSASPPAPGPNNLLAEGHINAQRIRLAPYVLGPATLDLRLYPDRLEVWPVTIRLYGGSLQASARTDRRQTPQRFSANMEARNLNLGEFVDINPASRGNFAGTGELDLQLIGSLDATWMKSLTGHGEFTVRNGRIRGLNLAGTAQSMAEFLGLGGDVTFTAITGDVNVRDQRISSRDIHLSSPRDTADMVGSLGFDGSLNFDGQLIAQIAAAAAPPSSESGGNTLGNVLARNGGKITLPFALRGTLAAPQMGPGKVLPSFPAPATCCASPNLFHK